MGLTIVYAVSGIAVNHREHWDYNYSSRTTTHQVGTPAVLLGTAGEPADAATAGQLARRQQGQLVSRLLAALGRRDRPRSVFWRGPERLSLFFGRGERDVIDYLPSAGRAEHHVKRDRFILRELNLLHLNERRGIWTYVADAFAALLLFLAVTGVIVVRGRRGLRGRGGLIMTAGIALPLAILLLRC